MTASSRNLSMIERLERAVALLGYAVRVDGEVYQPLFNLMEQELQAEYRQRDLLGRVSMVLEHQTSGGALKAIR